MDIKEEALAEIEKQNNELDSFRRQYNVTAPANFKLRHSDMKDTDVNMKYFNTAVAFCEEVLDATEPKNRIYARLFDVSKEEANKVSSQFHRTKWVQELMMFLRPDEQTLYFGERKRIIQAGMAIIDDPNESARNKTEAMKALTPYIKQEKLDNEINVKVETKGESIAADITKKLTDLAEQGKMVDDSGNIIDVVVID